MSQKVTVSIIGAAGYTGLELLKLLLNHPKVELKHLVSKNHVGMKISELYPHLQNVCDLTLTDTIPEKVAAKSDVVFLALPHLVSQQVVPKLFGKTKIVDLAGDFRIQDQNIFTKYYKAEHSTPELIPEFVYGFPEFQKEHICEASYVANPGCFAITAQLALLPLSGLIEHAEILAITGSSGSGKTPQEGTHHPVRNHNIKSYKIGQHQHLPEIMQTLWLSEEQISFVPTSGPYSRGIHLTAFIKLKTPCDPLLLFEKSYCDTPFVRIKKQVELAAVVGSNFCDISVNEHHDTLIVQAVIDNLVKGAAGNAIQNFNLMEGFAETTGLESSFPLYP